MTERSRILVTGANGFVGSALCNDLVRNGYMVRATVREPAKFSMPGCEVVAAPAIEADWAALLRGVACVIHLAARVHVMRDNVSSPLDAFRQVNVVGTECLAKAAAANGVKRLVYVSSIKVNGEATFENEMFVEDDPAHPQDHYGISKWEAEQTLHRIATETGLEMVIVRPPIVYGAAVKGNFSKMLKVVSKGIPLPLASIANLRSFIYVGNLTSALTLCAMHPSAAGQTYLVSDGEDISTTDLLRQLGAAMGLPARLFFCPSILLNLMGYLTGNVKQVGRLLGSLQVDSSKIRRELNWMPPYTLQQGLQLTVTSWLK